MGTFRVKQNYFYFCLVSDDQGRHLPVGGISLMVTLALGKYDHFAKSNPVTNVTKPFQKS
jgi:hypothetical protein